MPVRSRFLALAILVACLLLSAPTATAQLPPVLQPGDTLRFVGADLDRATSGPCDAVVADCVVSSDDLGSEEIRMYVASALLAGGAGVEVRAMGRLLGRFNISGDNGHRIGAKLDGLIRWRGWLTAQFGAFDNGSTVDIAVAIYDVTTVTQPSDTYDHLVARQTVYTNAVAGEVGLSIHFERAIGNGSFNLAVDLFRGHSYIAVLEATCRSTGGLVGIATASSFSQADLAGSPIDDGFIERTRMLLRTEPDYLELIENLGEQFSNHRHGYLTGRGEGHNNTPAETSGPVDSTGLAGSPGPSSEAWLPQLEIHTTAPNEVRLGVRLPAGADGGALIERSSDGVAWKAQGIANAGPEWVDPDVTPGARYAYRAHASIRGITRSSEVLWIRTPEALGFGLSGAHPNPVVDGLVVRFSIPDRAAASLELFDITGRRMLGRDVGSLGPGEHTLKIAEEGALPPGIYLLRLTRGRQSLAARLSVID